MAILGNIIKSAIHLKETFATERDHWQEQQDVLAHLLETAKDTKFGEYYKLESILDSDDQPRVFTQTIPYFDYDKMNREWWQKLHEGQDNVTWPGHPSYFALSSRYHR